MRSNIFLYGILGPFTVLLGIYVFCETFSGIKAATEQIKKLPEIKIPQKTGDKISNSSFITYLLEEKKISEAEKEIPEAEKLDPDNARYNYIKSARLIKKSLCKIQDDQKTTGFFSFERHISGTGLTEHLGIGDQAKFDEAILEFIKGSKKKYFRTYEKEATADFVKKQPPCKKAQDLVIRKLSIFRISFPDTEYFRDLNESIIPYAEYLLQNGQKENATEIIDAWTSMFFQRSENIWSLIEEISLLGNAKYVEKIAELYEKLGKKEKAARLKVIAKEFREIKQSLYKKEDNLTASSKETNTRTYTGMPYKLSSIYFESINKIMRATFYRFALGMLICFILLFAFLNIYIAIIVNHFKKSAPLIEVRKLEPGFMESAGICMIGILVPILFCIAVNPGSLKLSTFTNTIWIAIGIILLMHQLTTTSIYKKAAALSFISKETLKRQKKRLLLLVTVAIFSGICIVLTKNIDSIFPQLAFCVLLIISLSIYRPYSEEKEKGPIILQASLPLAVAGLLFMTLVCYPLLLLHEKNVIRENYPEELLPTHCEAEVVQSLKDDIQKVIRESAKTDQCSSTEKS